MKPVLYLHGLDAKPSPEKNKIMREEFGLDVLAPQVNYRASEKSISLFENLSRMIDEGGHELLIGSSFGGYMSFYLSEFFDIPAILFNPALHSRNIDVPVIRERKNTRKIIVIGKNDEIINSAKTRKFLIDHEYQNYGILDGNFGHRTSPELFGSLLGRAIKML